MHLQMTVPMTPDEHLASLPQRERALLERIRAVVRELAPTAVETIAYGVPTFTLDGRNLLHYAGFARHCSLFPGSAALLDAIGDDVARFRSGRGTLRFTADDPLPEALVRRIVEGRLAEEAARPRRTRRKATPPTR